LFDLLDEGNGFALVHLTWVRTGPERRPWPSTALFDSLDAFVEEARLRD
jgi:hypothetical protein